MKDLHAAVVLAALNHEQGKAISVYFNRPSGHLGRLNGILKDIKTSGEITLAYIVNPQGLTDIVPLYRIVGINASKRRIAFTR